MNESRKKINICLSDRFTCKNGLYGSGTSDWQCSQTENVRNLRGTFAIVKEYDNKVECICDIIRSIPIFYYIGEFDVYISDKVETILMKVKEKIDINLISIKEYLMLGYVSETNTLFNQIYTVCAGERVTISDAGGCFMNNILN